MPGWQNSTDAGCLCMAVTPGSRVAQIHTGDEISLQGQVSITLSYLIKAHKSKHGDTGQFITIWCILLLVAVHLLLCPVYIFNFLITVYIEEHTGRLGVSTPSLISPALTHLHTRCAAPEQLAASASGWSQHSSDCKSPHRCGAGTCIGTWAWRQSMFDNWKGWL